jgi:hypothetical protein
LSDYNQQLENGFTICYTLYGGDMTAHTIELSDTAGIWATITHMHFYSEKTSSFVSQIGTMVYGSTTILLEYNVSNWNSFCLTCDFNNSLATVVVDQKWKKTSSIQQLKDLDMVIFKIRGMFTKVNIYSGTTYNPLQKGDIHSWNSSLWNFDKTYGKYLPNLDAMRQTLLYFPIYTDGVTAYKICKKLGGTIANLNKTERKDVLDLYLGNFTEYSPYVLSPYMLKLQKDMNYVVKNAYNETYVIDNFWNNCTVNETYENNFFAYRQEDCKLVANYDTWPFFCDLAVPKILQLQGICNKSSIDQYYVLAQRSVLPVPTCSIIPEPRSYPIFFSLFCMQYLN